MKTGASFAAIILLAMMIGVLTPARLSPGSRHAWAAAEWTDFTLSTPGGDRVTLSDLVGKKAILLAFWATWCPYCNAAIPRLSAIETGPLRDKVTLLALDYLESGEKVAAFIGSKRIPYRVLLDRDGRVARRYGVVGIPTYILIDRNGRIAWRENALPEDLAKSIR